MATINDLRNKSVYIIREVKNQFENPAVLCSFGKDSTVMLYLIKDAFGEIPFPVVHLDTGYKFPEMYEFRDQLQKDLGFELIISKNEEALAAGMGHTKGHFECCNALKTENLKNIIKEKGYDALLVGIRRDEHSVRSKEHYFSPRDNEFQWKTSKEAEKLDESDSGLESLQDPEFSGWDLYASEHKDSNHIRVHPILHWSEPEIWEYLKLHDIKVNPLYFSKDGKRYRSLGCIPCTHPLDSDAKNIDEIIEEIKQDLAGEREGRISTKEYNMEKLRSLGYM
jgi:sulfate adenylyltransferase subunit 2